MSFKNGASGGGSKLPPRKPINTQGFKNAENSVNNKNSQSKDGVISFRSKPLNIPSSNENTSESKGQKNSISDHEKTARKPLNIPTTNSVNTSVDNKESISLSTPPNNTDSTHVAKDSEAYKINSNSYAEDTINTDDKSILHNANSDNEYSLNGSFDDNTDSLDSSVKESYGNSSDNSTLLNSNSSEKTIVSTSSSVSSGVKGDSNTTEDYFMNSDLDVESGDSMSDLNSEVKSSTPENIDSKPVFKFNPNVRNAKGNGSSRIKEDLSDVTNDDFEKSNIKDFNSSSRLDDTVEDKLTVIDKKASDVLSTPERSLGDSKKRLSFNPYGKDSSRGDDKDFNLSDGDSFTYVDNDSIVNDEEDNSKVSNVDNFESNAFRLNFSRGRNRSSESSDSFGGDFESESKSYEDYLDSESSSDSSSYFEDDSVVFDDNLVDETVQFYDENLSEAVSLDDESSTFEGYFGGVDSSSRNTLKSFREEILESTMSSDTVDNVNSSIENDPTDSGGSFDDILGDLFSDDDSDFESLDRIDSSSKDVSEDLNFEESESVFEGFSGGLSEELLDNVVANASRDLLPSEADSEVKAGQKAFKEDIRSKMKRDREDARKSLKREEVATPVSKPVDTRNKPLPINSLETGFKQSNVREVLVDSNGETVKSSNTSVDELKDSDLVSVGSNERQRYRYLSKDGKMNVAELNFFKNFANSKAEVRANPDLLEGVRSPLGWDESEFERKARADKIVRTLEGKAAYKRNSKMRFNQKDRELLQFLALFRYATDAQLSRMFSEAIGTTYNRLKKLRQQGLVIDKKIYGNRPIWFLTSAGMILSGYDLPRITESKLTFSMFPHQFTVNNTAANLWGANLNVLNQEGFPAKNRIDDKGKSVYGEQLVSELEIQSSFGKMRMFDKSDVYRPQLLSRIDREFKNWEDSGGAEFGDSPEMNYGNEYMWALYPPMALRVAYHVPDLVIKRSRDSDGSPNSIAVEIEISNKALDSYERTLRAYKADRRLYKKVVWVCKNTGPARKLIQVAKDIGLYQEGRIDIVPILTENGVFKERDLWTI